MQEKICPNCHTQLGSYDHFFCSSCAFVLPQDLVNEASLLKTKVYKVDVKGFTLNFPKLIHTDKVKVFFRKYFFKLILLLLTTFIILTALYIGSINSERIFTELTKAGMKINQKPLSSISNPATLNVKLPLKSGSFDSSDLADYVPSEVDLYIEANDLTLITPSLVKVSLGLDAIINEVQLENHFVIFYEEEAFVFLFKPKNISEIGSLIKATKITKVKLEIVGDVLAVVFDDYPFENIKNSKEKVILNFALNSKYIIAKARLAQSGKLMVIVPNNDGFLGLSKIKDLEINGEVNDLIDQILKSGYNKIVII